MALNFRNTIKDVAIIFNNAQLEVLCPKIYGLGKELGVLNLALYAIGDEPEVQNKLMNTRGIKLVIEHADFAMRKIAGDEILSRLIHDRTCSINGYINAFLPESKGRLSNNIVREIEQVAPELSKLKAKLYPPKNETEEDLLPGMMKARPERERFKETVHDIETLKSKLLASTL